MSHRLGKVAAEGDVLIVSFWVVCALYEEPPSGHTSNSQLTCQRTPTSHRAWAPVACTLTTVARAVAPLTGRYPGSFSQTAASWSTVKARREVDFTLPWAARPTMKARATSSFGASPIAT